MLNEKFWEKYFRVYDVLNLLIPYQDLLRDVCDELDIKKGDLVLEAGCGTGNLALEIKKRGARVVGIDGCKKALDIYKEKDPEANVILSDLTEKLPFPDNYFDKISLNNVLYTISKDKQKIVLNELYRVLRFGGKIAIVNPMKNWKPYKIYSNGISESLKRNGFFIGLFQILKLIKPAILILYYNNLIKKEAEYYFFKPEEQKKIIKEAKMRVLKDTKLLYAGQCLFNVGEK